MPIELLKQNKEVTITIADAQIVCLAPKAEVMQIAKLKMQKSLQALIKQYNEQKELGVDNLANLDDIDILAGLSHSIFVSELAKYVIKSWSGVMLDNKPAELNAENIELLFANFIVQDQFMAQYDQPLKVIEAEKKPSLS